MLDLFCIWIARPKSPTFILYFSFSCTTGTKRAVCTYLTSSYFEFMPMFTTRDDLKNPLGGGGVRKIPSILVTAGERPKREKSRHSSNHLCIFPTPYFLTPNQPPLPNFLLRARMSLLQNLFRSLLSGVLVAWVARSPSCRQRLSRIAFLYVTIRQKSLLNLNLRFEITLTN